MVVTHRSIDDFKATKIEPCSWFNTAQYLVQSVQSMDQSSNQSLTNLILQAISAVGEGVALQDLLALPGLSGERRKVQRLLQTLVKEGKLRKEGVTRGTRYWLAAAVPPPTAITPLTEDYPPLSPAAELLRAEIRKPVSQRTPVPYYREFLDAYYPNQTFYLPEQTRNHLRYLGQPKTVARTAGTYARQILERLLIGLSFNSSRLEGNTYSILDTERLVLAGQESQGKDIKETQMILNHKGAIEYLVEEAEHIAFNLHTIRNLHALLSENLMGESADSGRVRIGPLGIKGTVYRPLEIPSQIEESLRQLLHTAQAIEDPFEQSFFALVHLPYLQPFMDVNKRTSRLAANIPFIRENLCPISFSGVPGDAYTDGTLVVYEFNKVELLRDVFTWAYERSCKEYQVVQQTLGEPDPFRLRYRDITRAAVQRIVKEAMSPKQTQEVLQEFAKNVDSNDRIHFYAVVETELNGLHEGNIIRYRLSEEVWRTWRTKWDQEINDLGSSN
jgi:Fic family protein